MPSASGSGVASAAAAAAQGMTPRRSAVRRAGRDRAGALILDPEGDTIEVHKNASIDHPCGPCGTSAQS